jgi:hypothetical protein
MPVSIRGIKRNDSLFPYRDPHIETGINTSPYGNGKSLFPYGESKNTAPHFQMGILIYRNGDFHIPTSPYGNGECPFPYGESQSPCFHTGIPTWKWGLTHPHMEMGNICSHMGNHKKWLPVSIQGSPSGNRD